MTCLLTSHTQYRNERADTNSETAKARALSHTCEMLMKLPLDPAVTMRTTLLVSWREFCASLPASSRALFSTWFTWLSNDSMSVRPGCDSRSWF
jgi:hypothetical protein